MTNIMTSRKNQHIIQNFENYMLSPKNMMKISNQCNLYNPKIIIEKKKKVKESNLMKQKMFIPGKKDTLFWIFYILLKGFEEYNLIGTNFFTLEKNMKIELINEIKSKKSLLKSFNISKLSTCEDDLLNNEIISLKTFHVLCIIKNINFVFVTPKLIYEFKKDSDDSDDDFFIIHKTASDHFAYEIDGKLMLENYRTVKYSIQNLEKPFKCISYYRVEELKEIAGELGVPTKSLITGKNLNKQDIYNNIMENINI